MLLLLPVSSVKPAFWQAMIFCNSAFENSLPTRLFEDLDLYSQLGPVLPFVGWEDRGGLGALHRAFKEKKP